MTAAQGMDVVERLPGCKGQAAGAVVSAKTQVKIEHAPVQTLDSSTTMTQVVKIMVQYGRPSRSS